MNVAILGSGNIGTDLLIKITNSSTLNCVLFAGRRKDSKGMIYAEKNNVPTGYEGIESVKAMSDSIDLLFDCTSASSHKQHWQFLKSTDIKVIDLTPSNIGHQIVPSVNIEQSKKHKNISLITCGGQGSLPIIHAISRVVDELDYVEVVNTISSFSAGPATRDNLDEYLETTEKAITAISSSKASKSILILNPADPCINMKTTVFATVGQGQAEISKESLVQHVNQVIAKINNYIPGYKLLLAPVVKDKNIIITIEVIGKGDYLPKYAGNLDIITCAAVEVAEYIEHTK